MTLSFVFFALSTAMLFDGLGPMKVLFFVFHKALTPPLAFPLNVTLPRAASIELLFLQYGSQLLFPRLNLCKTWLHQPISLVRSVFPCLVTSPRWCFRYHDQNLFLHKPSHMVDEEENSTFPSLIHLVLHAFKSLPPFFPIGLPEQTILVAIAYPFHKIV